MICGLVLFSKLLLFFFVVVVVILLIGSTVFLALSHTHARMNNNEYIESHVRTFLDRCLLGFFFASVEMEWRNTNTKQFCSFCFSPSICRENIFKLVLSINTRPTAVSWKKSRRTWLTKWHRVLAPIAYLHTKSNVYSFVGRVDGRWINSIPNFFQRSIKLFFLFFLCVCYQKKFVNV